MLAFVSITPLGIPVVPEEVSTRATSSFGSLTSCGRRRGHRDPLTSSFWKSLSSTDATNNGFRLSDATTLDTAASDRRQKKTTRGCVNPKMWLSSSEGERKTKMSIFTEPISL